MQTLDRLISILELVAAEQEPVGAADIARATELPLSTVARLMRELLDAGMLHRSEPDGRYTLGSRVFALASAGASPVDLAEAAKPAMRRLRDQSGETTSLHVVRGVQRVCIAEVQSRAQVRRVVAPGSTNALVGTATGEVLLADAGPAEVKAAAEHANLNGAERTRLGQRLEAIRASGYSIHDDHLENLTGISAPVREGSRTVAALTISGPTTRFDRAAAERCAGAITEAARSLSPH